MTEMEIKNEQLYTDNKVLINEYVKKGRTVLFDEEIEAETFAGLNHSYYYDVYNSSGQSVGFAVPITVKKTIKEIG
tara:strand:+ start:35782 stop:36009 length:228 start_codon:yes stop_codon:yes gene_type:complete